MPPEIDREIIELYDAFTHGNMGRRRFMARLSALAGGTAAAMAVLPMIEPNYARAQMVPADDSRLDTGRVEYASPYGTMKAYSARPRGGDKLPAVLVIHENRGLNPHTEDVTRRLAVAGFLALAPDGLSPLGGTPQDPDEAREMIAKLDTEKTIAAYVAGVAHLKRHAGSTGKVGCVGFCWGGALANHLAIHSPDLDAAIVYYGRSPNPADAKKIRAAMLLHFAGLDARINATVPEYQDALKEAGVRHTVHVYENVDHAFNNDTGPARYNKQAADLAWERTIAFLKAELG